MTSRPVEIDPAAVQDKLREIETNSTSGDEEMALWVVVNLIFHTGLRLKEIVELEIVELKDGDVFSNNNIVGQITVDRKRDISRPTSYGSPLRETLPGRPRSIQLVLPQNVEALLNSYAQSVWSGRVSPATGSLPLFPMYSEESGRKKLRGHLERYRTGFMELRRAGVIRFFTHCRRNEPDPYSQAAFHSAASRAADHFQTTYRTVRECLRGIHRPSGQRTGEKRTLRDRAADLLKGLNEILDENKVRGLITEMEELFEDSVEPKKIYLEWLYCRIREDYEITEPVAIQMLEPPESPFKSLLEQIKRFSSEQEKYDPEAQRTRREEFERRLMIENKPKYKDLDELKQKIFDFY